MFNVEYNAGRWNYNKYGVFQNQQKITGKKESQNGDVNCGKNVVKSIFVKLSSIKLF